MKYFILFIMMVCCFTLLGGTTACSPDDTEQPTYPSVPPNKNEEDSDGNSSGNTENMKIELEIGGKTFTATLQNNATATAFKEMLPLTIKMSELNNNEKYYNLSSSLPTAATRPGTIQNGDIMLYGNNCLVLFYKTFQSSYSYSPIGSIDNPAGLETVVGTGNVTITWNEIK